MPQRDRHVHAGPVQQDQDLPGPRAVRPPRPRPPVIPGEQGSRMHVAGQDPERGPQVSHVQSPPHDGVGQGPATMRCWSPPPARHPAHPPTPAPRRRARPGAPARSQRCHPPPPAPPTAPSSQATASAASGPSTRRPPDHVPVPCAAPAVRIPQSRPPRAVPPAIIPAQGRHHPTRQPASSDHHALVSRQPGRTCEGPPNQWDQYHNHPRPRTPAAICPSPPLRRLSEAALSMSAAGVMSGRRSIRNELPRPRREAMAGTSSAI